MGILLLDIIITATLYCGPIIFLRYVIFKKKIAKNKALLFVGIWTFIVFIGVRIFTDYMYGTTSSNGAPAGLWGMVNYFILADTKRKKATKKRKETHPDRFFLFLPAYINIKRIQDAQPIRNTSLEDIENSEAHQIVYSPCKQDSYFSSDRKHNLLIGYSVIVTVLAIVLLGLSIKFYNDSQRPSEPFYLSDIDGNLHKMVGYYSSTGEHFPFD